MAAVKSKTPKRQVKSTKPSAKKGLVSSRFKFNKLGVLALAAVLGVAGVVYVYSSHAATPNPYSCPAPQPTIEAYSQGNCVKYLQYVLLHDASQTSVTTSGLFDQATVNGVKNVQTIAHLTVDGIVGPNTWAVINKLNATNGCALATDHYYECYWNSAGIHHTGGKVDPNFTVYYPTIGFTTRTLWDMPDNGHYGWYGPYATVTANTIQACWWFVADRPRLGYTAKATFDVTADSGQTILWSSGSQSLPVSTIIGHGTYNYWTLLSKCQNVHIGHTVRNFEIRAKYDGNDNPSLYMYKTAWQVLN